MPRPCCAADRTPGGFIVCWLLTLTGSVGVFLAADLVGFYFLLAVLSVGPSGLVIHDGTARRPWRAGALYLGLALLPKPSCWAASCCWRKPRRTAAC